MQLTTPIVLRGLHYDWQMNRLRTMPALYSRSSAQTMVRSLHGVRMVQKETALESPLVAQGKQLGRQLASAAEAQHAKRRAPSAPRHAEVNTCNISSASQHLPLKSFCHLLPKKQHVP